MKKIIKSDKLSPPVGAYSQAIEYNNMIFLSGQIAYSFEEKRIINDNIELETKIIMNNIKNFLQELNLDFQNIIKVNVFLKNIEDFSKFNNIYKEYFNSIFPVRIVVGGLKLPLNVSVELEFIIAK